MTSIGIVGAGIGGLHLALYLQQHDVPATLYAELTSQQRLAGRLPNTAVHWGPTREREHALGVNHWDEQADDWCVRHVHFYGMFGARTMTFTGMNDVPGIGIDHRIYTSTLLEDFLARGGDVVYGAVMVGDLPALSDRHDLVVVSAGRGSMVELFERRSDGRPFTEPQRFICTGIFDGIAPQQPIGSSINVIPGSGELFQLPFLTFGGRKTALLTEIIPGGQLDELRTVRYEQDPVRFNATVLRMLRTSFPHLAELVDENIFGITRAEDVLQGAITPTARRGYAQLENGKWVMALGDVSLVNDPVLAQGANTASACAFLLGEAILADNLVFDEMWCARAEARMWDYQRAAFEWTNHMLRTPLPGNATKLITTACGNPEVARSFINNYAAPQANWDILASDARTDAYLTRHGGGPVTPPSAGDDRATTASTR
ncbi:styrene monooxygenase/indole monooxygenase family protein [Kibdelosporangium phytohabitans]|uniref:Styrene monooxygenase StyA putative substrate binding domain-containing protein n=1 Tax=Kibdelosporangium phytohabitans TaxID=860235 RepID=A0A0N9HY67_9PSEU|nr:styrene monooxygenase/indole monooxygenase family protein [Kibdelosporangium phytohabitans]ALG10398.1 hypothetical protein AOZ06_29035 [Kibdelosporangium phytohabitans]MBE1461459.1 hypothetical protein [Kibdelosporangium phytohabitans]